MATALWQLGSLKLQITPRSDIVDHENAEALDFLPQLLEKMIGLKSLDLVLITAERVEKQRRLSLALLDETCYTYSQVFPRRGKWPNLQRLYLAGLAIHGLDMTFLLFNQIPGLQRLWLNHINLLGGKWEGVVEAMRIRGAFIPWDLLSLQGSYRHLGGQWWPDSPDTEEEQLALGAYMNYATEGGRHPSLPAGFQDSLSINYFNELYYVAGLERIRALRLRIQQLDDRRT
ncbi:hypothetical protein HO133_003530 [Letharia lupina]|uniref:Uncharacterized protein n=1 Tax=Letharia lupina TaxID=560253 RepID=A0A8H6C9V6_9LECA|nr:uncharacterized protein HO133_003530 [Letharia lupina]KAF6219705.1 hypothetical protein HO133_003530 [Letharia lupina]